METKIWDTLLEYGIDSYRMSILSPIPTTAEQQIPIAKQIPQQVGLIFGMSIYTDTITPAAQPLITTADAENLYLTFKDGPTDFLQPVRLDEMNYNFVGVPNVNPQLYLPVNIQGNFDLSTSFYSNPSLIFSIAPAVTTIMLNLWYISTESYLFLIKQGVVKEDANRFLSGKRK